MSVMRCVRVEKSEVVCFTNDAQIVTNLWMKTKTYRLSLSQHSCFIKGGVKPGANELNKLNI